MPPIVYDIVCVYPILKPKMSSRASRYCCPRPVIHPSYIVCTLCVSANDGRLNTTRLLLLRDDGVTFSIHSLETYYAFCNTYHGLSLTSSSKEPGTNHLVPSPEVGFRKNSFSPRQTRRAIVNQVVPVAHPTSRQDDVGRISQGLVTRLGQGSLRDTQCHQGFYV